MNKFIYFDNLMITISQTGGGVSKIVNTSGGSIILTKSTPPGGVQATGGTVTTYGSYKVHTFTTSGTFTVTSGGSVDVLVVGGGGHGGTFVNQGFYSGLGGGGGGQVIYSTGVSATPQMYTITVGSGGTVSPDSTATSSIALGVTANPGENGGILRDDYGGTSGSGQIGGRNSASFFTYGRGQGGGGDSQPGAGPSVYGNGGNGGDGTMYAISGSSVYYGGGGGGGTIPQNNYTPGSGGLGGGGTGAWVDASYVYQLGTPGLANSGGGGGGGQEGRGALYYGGSADGGSGIVIIRYLV
jgi:hypothetical protein